MSAPELRPDEAAMLAESGRCAACGHLDVLHVDHCCEFCTVDPCPCQWGRMPTTE